MNRIKMKFQELAEHGKKALIPYITAGDPDLAITEDLIVEMAAAGADLIELGVPFSDPMADGPVIQRASERALAHGVTLRNILTLVERVRRRSEVPIILFSYYNPLLQYGSAALASAARSAGVDGVLVTDLVPEEAADFHGLLRAQDLEMIFLLAPTSNDRRVAKVAQLAGGFIYAVARTGVTGMQENFSDTIIPLVACIKAQSRLPVAVGFGISSAEHVHMVWQHADAAVVGSRIVAEIEACAQPQQAVSRVVKLIGALRELKLER
ncbi:MAG: tryptophan synthase subunit alpha [Acidobacteriota bacterium]